MGIFSCFWNWLGGVAHDTYDSDLGTMGSPHDSHCCDINNPATGLMMIGGCGGVDTAGNPYGTDLHASNGACLNTGFSDDDWPCSNANTQSCWDD